MIKISIDQDRCKGCELCLAVCPQQALSINEHFNSHGYRYIVFNENKKCLGCKLCAQMCPDIAITIYENDK